MGGEARSATGGGLLAPAGRFEAVAAAALLVLGIVACLRMGRGYFLADDFVQLANFAYWQSRGELWREVLARFAASIDGVNGFYRPLTFVTYALNFTLGEAHAGRWLGVNLALHLGNAAMVAFLVARLAGAPTRGTLVAALGAAVFFFTFAPVWEVAAWVACRYDALATFFTLATGLLVLSGRRGWALLATVAALLSKESGAGAIVLAAIAAVLRAREHEPRARAWIHDSLRVLWPWVVVGLAYAALRWIVFGSPTEVYRGAHPQLLSPRHWATLLSTGIVFAREVFPGQAGVRGLVATSAVLLACGLWLAAARGRLAGIAAMIAMTLAALALLLPHVTGFEPNGIGGRLFYQPAAFLAATLGLAAAHALTSLRDRAVVATVACVAAAAFLAANIHWGVLAGRDYLEAQWSLRDAAGAIARIASGSPDSDFDLVVVPDAVGRVPFARNAQAGLMMPPVQPRDFSRKLLVQTDAEIAAIDRTIDGGALSALRALGLRGFMQNAGTRAWPRLAPSRYLCWDARRHRMVTLTLAHARAGAIGEELAGAYAASDCARADLP